MRYNFDTIDDVVLTDRTILLRSDINVPISNGKVLDDSRITSTISTLNLLLNRGAKIVIISHLGRPGGMVSQDLSLELVTKRLSHLMDFPVGFVSNCIGNVAHDYISKMMYGSIVVLENLRFYKEEESNDEKFALELSSLGNIYINDALSCSHRMHASIVGIPKFIRSVAGPNLKKEVEGLFEIIDNMMGRFVVLIGGSKISTKIDVIKNLVQMASHICIGGGLANTFLHYHGFTVGKSLFEDGYHGIIEDIYKLANSSGCEIVLPNDVVTCKELRHNAEHVTKLVTEIDLDDMIVDCGENTISNILDIVSESSGVICNGPFGAYETKPFHLGTLFLVKKIADLTKDGNIMSIAGGGDIIACIKNAGVANQFSLLTNAGGAFLEFISGYKLPGLEILNKC